MILKHDVNPAQKSTRAKRKNISPSEKIAIQQAYLDLTKKNNLSKKPKPVTGQDVRRLLLNDKKYRFEKNDVPSARTIQTYSPKNTGSLLDKPWTTASLNEYPLPSEIVALLIGIQEENTRAKMSLLTCRHARWIARLKDVAFPTVSSLMFWTDTYAWREYLSEVGGEEFDTWDIDRVLGRFLYIQKMDSETRDELMAQFRTQIEKGEWPDKEKMSPDLLFRLQDELNTLISNNTAENEGVTK